ncbi:DNA polymerase II large subunit [uncultured archaeon]|nr:DNA polymerase II large subunit [uncultured archaeon]
MDIDSYFKTLDDQFQVAYGLASRAKAKGFDPHDFVEIRAAPDLAGKVEGLMGVAGIADLIIKNQKGRTRAELAFCMVKEICTNPMFESFETLRRIELAVRTGLAIYTEGILVAPTEGVQGIGHFKNSDNSDYISVFYAGPIRSAGGTAVALSVAFADYARRFFNIGAYKVTPDELERYLEEVELYHERVVNLQYKPSADELRTVCGNCCVCVDGLPTEDIEVSVHANLSRRQFDGKDMAITNRVRGGVPLVLSSIVQKAKSVFKEVKKVELDWGWMSGIITVDKSKKVDTAASDKEKTAVFLEELVAGRPILAYPKRVGGFRLRYGRARTTGIAAKGFSPATAILTMEFIAVGTQLKVEFPGKGCVAAPVDTIEGPFIRLKSGEALRVNDAETAMLLKNEVAEILSLGDILITFGDFKKTNTPLQPSSYVEEFWEAQLRAASREDLRPDHKALTFKDAYAMSQRYGVPIHPRFLFEFQAVGKEDLTDLAKAVSKAKITGAGLFGVSAIEIGDTKVKRTLELMNVPHKPVNGGISVVGDNAQSLLASLGFAHGEGALDMSESLLEKYKGDYEGALAMVNAVAPFRIMKRSTYVGARIGRPEKARERLMKPSPHVLFPIGEFGGKERNLSNAYSYDCNKFGRQSIKVDMARYKCDSCGMLLDGPYCYRCNHHASIERFCPKCNKAQHKEKCETCGTETQTFSERNVDFMRLVTNATAKIGVSKMPKHIKGVKSLMNRNRIAEPLEKGILRARHNIFIFKDGTSRFDATDQPLTHFYPSEMGVTVQELRALGYDKAADGSDLAGEDQLVEMRHQDVILNKRGAEYLMNVAKFMDDMLQQLYGLEPYYNVNAPHDMLGKLVLTLAPHTSCAVLNRVVGFTDANVGFAHPFIIAARRRNCDGDEDTTMLLLDALINFSKEYLPTNIGGTMDEPLLLTTRVMPEEVDDEVHAMDLVESYPLEFYEKTLACAPPSEVKIELVENRLNSKAIFDNLRFSHGALQTAIKLAPKKSVYTQLKTMDEKIEAEFRLMDMITSIDKPDAAKRLIMSHFLPDLIGNLHSYSKQRFRCASCNAKYRRVPLVGKCTRDGGKLLLTISKGGIEKYLDTATNLANRYDLDNYTKQRIMLIRDEIDAIFGSLELNVEENKGQFNLANFL